MLEKILIIAHLFIFCIILFYYLKFSIYGREYKAKLKDYIIPIFSSITTSIILLILLFYYMYDHAVLLTILKLFSAIFFIVFITIIINDLILNNKITLKKPIKIGFIACLIYFFYYIFLGILAGIWLVVLKILS